MATFGSVSGVKVLDTFSDRQECVDRGVHGVNRAGIHGSAELGAFSIVMSGRYPDRDYGNRIVYIGEGGWHTGPNGSRYQGADQEETTGNLALIRSYKLQHFRPVRVIRGSLLKSNYAPFTGFRYDGLYKVVKYRYYKPKDCPYKRYEFFLERVDKKPAIPIRHSSALRRIKIKGESSRDSSGGSLAVTPRKKITNPFTSPIFRKAFDKVVQQGRLFANRKDVPEGRNSTSMPRSSHRRQ